MTFRLLDGLPPLFLLGELGVPYGILGLIFGLRGLIFVNNGFLFSARVFFVAVCVRFALYGILGLIFRNNGFCFRRLRLGVRLVILVCGVGWVRGRELGLVSGRIFSWS